MFGYVTIRKDDAIKGYNKYQALLRSQCRDIKRGVAGKKKRSGDADV